MDYKQLLVQFTEGSTYIQAHLNKVPKTPVHLKVEVAADQGIYVARKRDNKHLGWKTVKKPDAYLVIYISEEDDDTIILMTKD